MGNHFQAAAYRKMVSFKEVNRMPKYIVQVAIPTVYVIDARTEQQAMQQAAERFKTEHHTQLEPELQWAKLTGAATAAEWRVAE
jgi:hypothetical protein